VLAPTRYRDFITDSARWEGFVFRPGDIVVSTPPKCGTTWTQMICALLVFQKPTFDKSLDLISPWLDMLTGDIESVRADLDAQTHRRFIKSHTPYDGLPHDPSVTYIAVGRDPRDVFRSWDNHLSNMNLDAMITAREKAVGLEDIFDKLALGPPVRADDEIDRFWEWVDDDTPITEKINLHYTIHHLQSFWDARHEPNVVLLHYSDLQGDLEGEMRRLAERLQINVDDDRWSELVEAARFENMRANAESVAPDTSNGIWNSNTQFFNRGCSGQWREILNADDLARYERRIAELAGPELIRWMHQGPVRTGAPDPSRPTR
jgi:hypothetical protein